MEALGCPQRPGRRECSPTLTPVLERADQGSRADHPALPPPSGRVSEETRGRAALGLTLSGCPGRAESLCWGWRGGFQHWLSCCRTNCGNLDTGVPNRVHQSFTAREYINYKQTRPLVEQHGNQRDTMETRLLLQPSSPSFGRAAQPGSRRPVLRLSHDTPLLLF